MREAPESEAKHRAVRWLRRRELVVALAAGLLIAAVTLGYVCFYPAEAPPVQPIPFSHRLHAGVKEIGCVVCHPGTLDADRAGVPPLQTCMLCHERIIITYPPIRDLRRHYEQGVPVEWERVNRLPEYVYFTHRVHIYRGFDCGRCHGDVKAMDRVEQPQEFTMGFCIQCHRDFGASHDCFLCHR